MTSSFPCRGLLLVLSSLAFAVWLRSLMHSTMNSILRLHPWAAAPQRPHLLADRSSWTYPSTQSDRMEGHSRPHDSPRQHVRLFPPALAGLTCHGTPCLDPYPSAIDGPDPCSRFLGNLHLSQQAQGSEEPPMGRRSGALEEPSADDSPGKRRTFSYGLVRTFLHLSLGHPDKLPVFPVVLLLAARRPGTGMMYWKSSPVVMKKHAHQFPLSADNPYSRGYSGPHQLW